MAYNNLNKVVTRSKQIPDDISSYEMVSIIIGGRNKADPSKKAISLGLIRRTDLEILDFKNYRIFVNKSFNDYYPIQFSESINRMAIVTSYNGEMLIAQQREGKPYAFSLFNEDSLERHIGSTYKLAYLGISTTRTIKHPCSTNLLKSLIDCTWYYYVAIVNNNDFGYETTSVKNFCSSCHHLLIHKNLETKLNEVLKQCKF